MRKHSFFLLVATLFLCGAADAQEAWNLERCIKYAHDNNIQIRQSELNAELAKENLTGAKGAALPNLNGFASNNYNFGQRIDPFTNQFANTKVRSNSFSLSSSVTLFDGFQIVNTVKQRQLDYQASKLDVDQQRNDISLAIAAAYLQILFNDELANVAREQIRVTKQQKDRISRLVEAGSVPKGNLLDVEAQLAVESVNVVNAENQLTLAKLQLRQLLQLPVETEFNIVQPNLNPAEQDLSIGTEPGMVYQTALDAMPQVKGAEVRLASSEKGISIAKGTRSPTLTISGSYGTGYSGAAQEVLGVTQDGTQVIGFTEVGGETVITPSFTTETEVIPFGDQFSDNLNRSFGFSLTVPIFNGFSTKTSITRAKISQEIATANLELTKNNLRQDIEQAYADAQAALKQFRAMEKSVQAQRESFKYAEQRFNLGVLVAFDYNNSKNQLAKAESDLVRAKFDYVFKTKVLDFYQGKALTF